MPDGQAFRAAGTAPGISTAEQAFSDLLLDAHLLRGDQLPALIRRHIPAFGGSDAVCFLADLQQTVLVPFLGSDGPRTPDLAEPLPIDTTLAGRAFQQLAVQVQTHQRGPAGTIAWVPLLDGTERLGVLAVTVADPGTQPVMDETRIQRLTTFAGLLAELVMTKTLYGDAIVRLRRRSVMGLAAEMQWSLLPPLTFACAQATVAAALEPAYQVAGDTVDYAVDGDAVRAAVLDGMGHGLASAQLATMAMAAYRNARRQRQSLADTTLYIDRALLDAFTGASFTTAVLIELDTDTGLLSWVNAGHPAPLLLRHGQLVKTLSAPPRPPLGMDLPAAATRLRTPHVATEQLEPGDCVLLYTDGVTEARSPAGEFFGERRLADLIVRNLAAGLPVAETMRRVMRALLEHQQGRLDDDASLLLVQWPTDRPAVLP